MRSFIEGARRRGLLALCAAGLLGGCGGATFVKPSEAHQAARVKYLRLGGWLPGRVLAAPQEAAQTTAQAGVQLHRLPSGVLVGLDHKSRVVSVVATHPQAYAALGALVGEPPVQTDFGHTAAQVQTVLGPPEHSNAGFDTYELYNPEGDFRGSVSFYCPASWDSECRWMAVQWVNPPEE